MKAHRVVERQHPIFSPVGLAATAVLILSLGIALWLTGGRAFSPGPLSAQTNGPRPAGEPASHAAFEDRCTQCHEPFAGIQAPRCEACHNAVASQRRAGLGLHGALPTVADCAACHLEHQGRDVDLTAAAAAAFDHDTTAFSLAGHNLPNPARALACVDCHGAVVDLTLEPAPCLACHTTRNGDFMSAHQRAYGTDCLACHDGLDTLANLSATDHAAFFALNGSHLETPCAACHAGGAFAGTSADCAGCHAEPERHAGRFGLDCATCHTTVTWSPAAIDPAIFDHERDTAFSLARHALDFAGHPLDCRVCHQARDLSPTPGGCAACHAAAEPLFMAEHAERFGDECLACHDGVDRLANFDHSAVFALTGAHAEATCAACHAGLTFAGTPRPCVACHDEPGLHAGLFGLECDACHSTDAWQPARLMRHTFPLDHGEQGELDCATCHPSTFTAYTCNACHDPADMVDEHAKEGIEPTELPDCALCHPAGLKEREGED